MKSVRGRVSGLLWVTHQGFLEEGPSLLRTCQVGRTSDRGSSVYSRGLSVAWPGWWRQDASQVPDCCSGWRAGQGCAAEPPSVT